MSSLVIIDSECANLSSIYKAVKYVNLEPVISDDSKTIASARAIIFPGVGSFAHAASLISRKKLTESLLKAIAANIPFLGICLGMQLLFTRSEEAMLGDSSEPAEGLSAIPGEAKRFPAGLPVPHVGWNRVTPDCEDPLFRGLEQGSNGGAYFYFTHSYYVHPLNQAHILGSTDYGFRFTSAVKKENLYGVQFHPEKSGPAGLRLLSNFGKIIADKRD